MKTLINAFYLALFIAVALLGTVGDAIYSIWQEKPAEVLRSVFLLFFFLWLFSFSGLLVGRAFSLDWFFDWLDRRKSTGLPLAVVFLALTLGACASNVELQKDGTGTDEMLPSPCACLPVPYEPQFYRWDLG